MAKILIIEDDEDIAKVEKDYLELSGYEAVIASDGVSGLNIGLSGDYDLILLDLMLPGMDGFAVCKHLREKVKVPILMVTARREDVDKIYGLGLGADDYIDKPFTPSVLVAKVKAHLAIRERYSGASKVLDSTEVIIDEIRLNKDTHRVFVGEKEIELKNKEFELLQFFMENQDIVFGREELYEKIWGMEALGDNTTVAVHINRIREKIEEEPSKPKHLLTVWGAGYKFV